MKKKIAFISPEELRFSLPTLKSFSEKYNHYDIKFIILQKNFFKIKKNISYFFIFNIFEIFEIFFTKKLKKYTNFFKEKNIPIYNQDSLNNSFVRDLLINEKIEFLIILVSDSIVRKEILNIPNLKVLNFHSSKLPKYRGILPIFRAYSNNENEIGFTIFEVNQKIDDGIILSQKILNISKKKGILKLYKEAFLSFPDLVHEAISSPLNIKNEDINSYFSYPNIIDLVKFRFKELKKILFKN